MKVSYNDSGMDNITITRINRSGQLYRRVIHGLFVQTNLELSATFRALSPQREPVNSSTHQTKTQPGGKPALLQTSAA
jgi:hypothetical protein